MTRVGGEKCCGGVDRLPSRPQDEVVTSALLSGHFPFREMVEIMAHSPLSSVLTVGRP
jgi:hypothetical protein